jgi:SAM-dependent methyltransferase
MHGVYRASHRTAGKIRSFLRRCLRSRVPLAVFACMSIAAATICVKHAAATIVAPVLMAWIFNAFVLGYSVRMARQWPRLRELRRGDYEAVWDALSPSPSVAARASSTVSDESSLRAAGQEVADRIAGLALITLTDDVLEIGSGVGRVGWAIAPICGNWTGCDVSKRMLSFARQRLAGFDNVHFLQLSDTSLHAVRDASIDVVYCTSVLAHLDEPERWQYVVESHRVLRAGGRLYIDTVALDSVDGWAMLSNNLAQRRLRVDPPYMPLPSTGEELAAYFRKAGFASVRLEMRGSLLIAMGIKA